MVAVPVRPHDPGPPRSLRSTIEAIVAQIGRSDPGNLACLLPFVQVGRSFPVRYLAQKHTGAGEGVGEMPKVHENAGVRLPFVRRPEGAFQASPVQRPGYAKTAEGVRDRAKVWEKCRSCMRTQECGFLSFGAPKGHSKLAQGNALGMECSNAKP